MRRPLLFLLGAGALAVGACKTERAIGNEPVGDPAYGIRFTIGGTNTPQGTVQYRGAATTATTATDTVRITIRGLDSLAGQARYTLWLRDSAATSFQRLTARIAITKTDTVINAQGDPVEQASTFTIPSTSSFSNGGSNRSFVITGGVPSGFAAGARAGLVLITIEDSPTATQPNPNRRPFWAARARYTPRGAAFTADTSAVRFGFWSAAPESLYVYVIGPQRGRATFRGDVMVVNDSSLPRPPRGYFYATYLVKRDDANLPIDTVYLGPQTSPPPRRDISLRDADSVIVDPLIQTSPPPQILAAAARASADTTGGLDVNVPFRGVADAFVTLELKNYKIDEARMGPAIVLGANVPTIVRNGPRPQ